MNRATVSRRNHVDKLHGTVKSAGRALEVLELFDDVRRGLSVGEVCGILGYPQSSTSMLMHSLTELGYLAYDRHQRKYAPTERVSLLGSWRSGLTQEGRLLSLMRRISHRCQRVVWLATRCGFQARDIFIVDESTSSTPILRVDTVRSLLTTGTGHAILSLLPDEELTLLVRRMLAEQSDTGEVPRIEVVMDSIRQVRQNGYCAVAEWLTPGWGAVVVPLQSLSTPSQPLVLGIRLTAHDVHERQGFYTAMMREELGDLSPAR